MNKRIQKKKIRNSVRLLDRDLKATRREAIYNLARKKSPTPEDIALFRTWYRMVGVHSHGNRVEIVTR